MTMNLKISKSKIKGSKNAILSMTLILLLATTLVIAFVQPAAGQAGVTGVSTGEKTAAYISVAPTLIGVGQTLTVNLWVEPLPTTYNYTAYWNGFYGVTVTFTRPDGTKDTFMPTDETGGYAAGEMQSLGALFFFYQPTMAGNWSISFTMPAQNITWFDGTVRYAGCTSNTATFTVQTDIVLAGILNGYPWAPLPNANVYWSYPINANNREWSQISGDWTGVSTTMATVNSPTQLRWQPYGLGPNTAHIVWRQPLKSGGIIGGEYGSTSYQGLTSSGAINFPAAAYSSNEFIMDNMVFITVPDTQAYASPFSQFKCFDESTGQLLYTANGTVTYGIHLPGNTYQQSSTAVAVGEAITLLAGSYGSYQYPYLWGSYTVNNVGYWDYYDPFTGVLLTQMANATSSRLIDGTVLAFGAGTIVGSSGQYVYRWNMTSVVNNNWPTGITWKVKSPITTGSNLYPTIFAVSPDLSTVVVGTKNQYFGYNANTGASIWNLTVNYPVTSNEMFPLSQVPEFIIFDPVAATFHCYSETTGAELWQTPSFASSPWATSWTVYNSETNDLNNLYFTMPDGSIYAYSLTDGHLVWTSKPIPSTEQTENVVPLVCGGFVLVDGKLYVYGGYSTHYQINPVPRFSMMLCINATNGDIIWTLNGGVIPNSAANGFIIGDSVFDGCLYGIGKGPTSTTVSAPQTAITAGTTVEISGSVLDTSSGSSSKTLTAMFANGVPAISDDNMSVWMDYLYMQNATLVNSPPICNGVPVTLTAVDPNGNVAVIGTATSNYQGNYGFTWTPTTPGQYTIYATFTGSNSYYTSSASTYATVSPAAATTTPAPTATSAPSNLATTSDLMTYIAVVGIAIIIVVAIGFIVLYRKK
jgi:hypothetical protein